MLQALSIRDFAIIDSLDLDLGPGLTVITGETGAGKSVLINALNLVLGGRAQTQVIRTGAEAARVEALFDLRHAPQVRARLAEAGLEAGDQLVVRRVVTRAGRHKVYLNGALATVNLLSTVASDLVDISGQHEHYSLLRRDAHLELIDRVAGLAPQREAVRAAHQAVAALDARVVEVEAAQRTAAEREDFLRFQLRELDQAELGAADEEQRLEAESRRLGNVERIREDAAAAERELYGADGSAVERLGRALRRVESLAELDADLAPMVEELGSSLAVAEDAARTLGDYSAGLDADPRRLEQVEGRLALFARLRRKFGADLGVVIARREALRAELAEIEGADSTLDLLRAERAAAARTLGAAADLLSAARRAGGDRLATSVCAELADLGMGGATLTVSLSPVSSGVPVGDRHVGARGADRVELLLSANPGEAPGPLHRIASGGELSRFMLAVKRVIAARDPVSVYVFDEVDTGVGGPTAQAIGQKLRAVSADRQALCITHLPQIAALGEHHLQVSKSVDGARTRSHVRALSGEDRVEEIARMLGGAEVTDLTRANAREMIRLGKEQAPQ